MRSSRGMGALSPGKVPKAIKKSDWNKLVGLHRKGGPIKKQVK